MNCKKKSALIILILLIISLIGISAKIYVTGHKFLKAPIVAAGQSIHYFFKPGDTVKSLADCLHVQGKLKHPHYLMFYAEIKGWSKQLKAGEYCFVGPLTPKQVLHQVINAQVVQHKIIFIEGWTFKDMLDQLNQLKLIKHQLTHLNKAQLLKKFAIRHHHLEGLFFPDTYNYIYGDTDVEILNGAHVYMLELLHQQWQQRADNLPYQSPYQALIVASLIQKEARLPSEDPLIASVIINRLKKNMYLQIDPTVIYALGSAYNNSLTSENLRIKNPYNTYVNKGLPPGPICMPGLIAIEAALHPATTNYLYFVAKGDGSHVFSETLNDHDIAIRKYILKKSTIKTSNEHTNR